MDERTDLRAASPLEDDDEGEEDEGDEGDGDDEVGALAAPANGSAAVGGAARPVALARRRRGGAAGGMRRATRWRRQRPLASAPVDIWGELTARNCNAVRFDYTEGVDACAMCQTVAESLHRSEAVCHCYKAGGSEYYEKCGEMLGLRAQADDVKAEADDNNWSDLYRSFGACEYVKFCPDDGGRRRSLAQFFDQIL